MDLNFNSATFKNKQPLTKHTIDELLKGSSKKQSDEAPYCRRLTTSPSSGDTRSFQVRESPTLYSHPRSLHLRERCASVSRS